MATGDLSAFVQGAREKYLEVVIGGLSHLGQKRQKLVFFEKLAFFLAIL